MASKQLPVVWCRPLIGGQRYAVLVTDHKTSPHLLDDDETEAMCHFWTTEIAVRSDLSDERKTDCLLHEALGHALLEATGLKRSFKQYLGLTEKQWTDFEEECLVRQYVPALLGALKANGWATLPPVPKTKTDSVRTPSAAAKRQPRKHARKRKA